MSNDIINQIIQIEKKFLPIKEILENDSKYKDLYKGFITIQSKVSFRPDILFLGINPGEGAFKEKESYYLRENKFPKRLILDESNFKNLELDWFKKGNARNEKINNEWKNYNWYEFDKKISNNFPARMIHLLQNVFEKIENKKHSFSTNNEIKEFEDNISNSVVYTNICQIATKSTIELEKIYSYLSKEPSLKTHWKHNYNGVITKNEVKNFFRQRTFELIEILSPKLIVCLGNTTYKELTYKSAQKNTKYFKSKLNFQKNENKFEFNVLTFSRKGNWEPNIKNIGSEIGLSIQNIN